MSPAPDDEVDFDVDYEPRRSSSGSRSRRSPRNRTPGIATAALVLGIISLPFAPCLVFGVAALICGIIGLAKTGNPDRSQGRGFALAGTIMGATSMVLLVPLMIAILLPALGAARRTAQRMQNATQLRGIHQGMTMYSNSNKYAYPGLDSKGDIVPNSSADTGNSGDGDTVEARFYVLLDGGFVQPEFAISPVESDAKTIWTSGPVTSDHYSYAMLSIDGTPGQPPSAYGRAAEWKQTVNSQAVIMSDRNLISGTPTAPVSIHSAPDPWKGSILWNDNHLAFEQSHVVSGTKYGSGSLNNTDNLFLDETNGADALMIYQGD